MYWASPIMGYTQEPLLRRVVLPYEGQRHWIRCFSCLAASNGSNCFPMYRPSGYLTMYTLRYKTVFVVGNLKYSHTKMI